jgi:hypothetical protein
VVEHFLGKEEVVSSILINSSELINRISELKIFEMACLPVPSEHLKAVNYFGRITLIRQAYNV